MRFACTCSCLAPSHVCLPSLLCVFPTVLVLFSPRQVCFRVRPFDRRERAAGERSGWDIDTRKAIITRRADTVQNMKHPPPMSFPCSTLMDESTHTEELYDREIRDIVASSMQGINGTVLSYGQTASGKVRNDTARVE